MFQPPSSHLPATAFPSSAGRTDPPTRKPWTKPTITKIGNAIEIETGSQGKTVESTAYFQIS